MGAAGLSPFYPQNLCQSQPAFRAQDAIGDGYPPYRQPAIPQLIHMRIVEQLSVYIAPLVARLPETSPIPDPEYTGSPHRPGLSPGFGKAVT